MDDNAQHHRVALVEEYLEGLGLKRMEWPDRSSDLNPIKHLRDYLGRQRQSSLAGKFMFENTQRDALARETKTSKSTVGTLSESKYWRGKRRQGLQVGRGLHFSQWAFSRQFSGIPLTTGTDNKRFVVCFRDGGMVQGGDETSKFLADDTSLEGVDDEHFLRIFRQQLLLLPPPVIRLTFFLEDLVINGNHVILVKTFWRALFGWEGGGCRGD
ncbi:hypothetical protein CDAR_48771 [Caerostris darwini]|uniref:Transposase n=1 Tax=Caerostris darwini TaxID=1538125 RepID=A0AAV4NI00_9ARAC|nr:hypothetical protein CDAR_48771 [Caerostris darwini]